MNASVLKALDLLQERAGEAPWTTTHADAANACGLRERTWRRAVCALVERRIVDVQTSRYGVSLAVVSRTATSDPGRSGRTPRTVRTDTQDGQDGHKRGKGESDRVPDVAPFVSDEEQTTTATTTAVEQTARGQDGHSRTVRTDTFGPGRTFQDGHSSSLRSGLRELYLLALERAEECGRLKAENASLRAALAAAGIVHRDVKPANVLAAPQEVAPCPPTKIAAPPATTPASATEPSRTPEASPTATSSPSSPSASPATLSPGSTSSAAPASPSLPLHPANTRAEIALAPEPEDVDRQEDVDAFRALLASPHASELEVEAHVARALSYGVRLHQAVASVAIAQASGSPLDAPARFAWSVINGKTLPTPGSSKTWAELRSSVLPALRADAAKKAARPARGDSGGAHKVEHVSRPLDRNPVQQRQQEVAARQAARWKADAARALAAAGGAPT